MAKQYSSKAWVVAVDMGYGHQRAALPLKTIAKGGQIITANNYSGIPASDRTLWQSGRGFYDLISRFKSTPVVGNFAFRIFDAFQAIQAFYPKDKNIQSPTLQLKQIYRFMESKEWGRHLIQKLNRKPVPLITTFFIPAFMAEYWKYQGPIYLVVTDADVSRAWVPLYPSKTSIRYCTSTQRAAARLRRYGVLANKIFYTGFPLPEELLGGKNLTRAKQNLKRRLFRLDPERRYLKRYSQLVRQYVGTIPLSKKGYQPPVVTFAIGGTGAQQQVGEKILISLAALLRKKEVTYNLIAGVHKDAARSFESVAKQHGLTSLIGKNIRIIVAADKNEYFQKFNRIIQTTDILWTKPSELIFYSALGIPIIIAPPIGSQEVQNRKWLLKVGAGVDQLDPSLTHEWLPDLVKEGTLAEAAMQGFVEVEKQGMQNIMKLIQEKGKV